MTSILLKVLIESLTSVQTANILIFNLSEPQEARAWPEGRPRVFGPFSFYFKQVQLKEKIISFRFFNQILFYFIISTKRLLQTLTPKASRRSEYFNFKFMGINLLGLYIENKSGCEQRTKIENCSGAAISFKRPTVLPSLFSKLASILV